MQILVRTLTVNRIITCALLWFACGLVQTAAVAEQGTRTVAPDWQLDGVNGEVIDFYSVNTERPAVILFWATWCPYCKALFPGLKQLHAEFADSGVAFYALNVWEDGDPKAYFSEHDIPLTLLLAGDLVAEEYGVSGTPAVFVVDRNHRIVYSRRRGESPDDVVNAIRRALQHATNQS